MPTVLLFNGIMFFFYSNENEEPAHVHVVKGNANGKIWLQPQISIAYIYGFSNSEEKTIIEVVKANQEIFKQKWNEYFG